MAQREMDQQVRVQRLICDKLVVQARVILADYPGLGTDMEVEVMTDFATGSLLASLRSWVLRNEQGCTEYLYKPSSWWEHFKESYFPAWALKCWPVQYTSMPFTSYRVCPHSSENWPNRKHIEFLSYDLPRQHERH